MGIVISGPQINYVTSGPYDIGAGEQHLYSATGSPQNYFNASVGTPTGTIGNLSCETGWNNNGPCFLVKNNGDATSYYLQTIEIGPNPANDDWSRLNS